MLQKSNQEDDNPSLEEETADSLHEDLGDHATVATIPQSQTTEKTKPPDTTIPIKRLPSNEQQVQSSKRSRIREVTSAVKELRELNSTLQNSVERDDECSLMGKNVAEQLRKLPIAEMLHANLEIQQVLMKYRLSNMTSFLPNSVSPPVLGHSSSTSYDSPSPIWTTVDNPCSSESARTDSQEYVIPTSVPRQSIQPHLHVESEEVQQQSMDRCTDGIATDTLPTTDTGNIYQLENLH